MRARTGLVLGHAAGLAAQVSAQFTSWQARQINTSICYWKQPRAALVRNIVYLDGGNIWWMPGLDSGELGTVVNNGNFQGVILTYNLSDPITPDTNTTGLLVKNELFKATGGKENGISAEPNSYDGGMLANDAEFFLYGGALFRNDDLYDQPAADAVLGYQAYQYGGDKPLWQKGFHPAHLDDGVTRYVASGAAVSAPSENKAWYFSGLTSPTRGPIMSNPNRTTMAMNISNTLITLDMTTQLEEKWSNSTLPDDIKGRSNAEVVWVPVGKQGILVVLGGVTYPEWATVIHKSEDPAASEKESPEFMRVIDIYDVAGDKCFNIHYYGGFDGIHPKDAFHDDVWVLSLPSFTWTQINNGTEIHARSGHKCFLPYPDQMMVFGGYVPEAGNVPSCLDKGPVVVFNITSGEWLDSYDPKRYGKYGVHEKVRATIGGDASGGATATAPMPSGWATSGLADVFAQKYDSSKIKAYWPYDTTAVAGRLELPVDETKGGGDKKSIIIPAVVVPVIVLAGVGVLVWWLHLRRRRYGGSGSGDSDEAASRIRSWIRGQGAEKALTMTSSGAPSPDPERARIASSPALSPGRTPSHHETPPSRHEMADTQLAELGDTSPPIELHDTGLTPVEVIQKHSHFAPHKFHSPPVLDSPLLGNTPQLARPDAAEAGDSGRMDVLPEEQEPARESPIFVTPPSGRDARGGDFLSAGETAGGTTNNTVDEKTERTSKLK
ncbi:Galactose oxidase/kelch, beta-propeller [Hirsutella rhossiliensis]|uniref:Galactose oxidase/kelch, beta-propeller n=1 Tax=Hirsutella rhossiliensis TaxID=111463 RepID=A0A9P8N2V9_9HYPO|nr:Galactose oxidase/kelch, beta-propeller [Hirsutella rhossiliensis]KAH0966658.1 Galactose oxidase/kelch, beta-propeller [Hirsutella rhossiliensis]